MHGLNKHITGTNDEATELAKGETDLLLVSTQGNIKRPDLHSIEERLSDDDRTA